MQTQYFKRSDGALAYTDYGGNGEPVLMVPGMGALRSEYRFIAPALSEAGYRAITMDLRGHGESSVPWKTYDVPSVGNDILALIEHLNTGSAHIIATSFSPSAAVWAAVEKPNHIRSLVLICPFVRDVKSSPIMKALFWILLNNPWSARVWGMYYNSLYPTQKPADFQDYLKQLIENMKQPGRMKAASALANSARQPSEERLNQVKVPTLVIMGTKDPDFPDPIGEAKFVAEQTGGHLALIENAGHYPQTEMPEKTTPIVLDFLRRSGQ